MNIKSVIIYLTTFGLSLLFTKLSEIQMYSIDNKKISLKREKIAKLWIIIFSSIAVIIPCLLASIRATTVGGDIQGYLLNSWNIALGNESFKSFYSVPYVNDACEVGFAFLVHICAKIKNFYILLFLIQLITILPIYISLYILRMELSITVGMATYLFFFYNITLSMMRQGIAEALVLMAFCLYYKNKKILSFSISIIAMLFHNSVIFILLCLIAIGVISVQKNRKPFVFISVVAMIFLFIYYRDIASLLSRIVGIVSARYSSYINRYIINYYDWNNIMMTDMLMKLLIFIFAVFSIIIVLKNKHITNLIFNLMLICLLSRYLTFFAANFHEAQRIAYFFDCFFVLLIPIVKKQCYRNNFITNMSFDIIVSIPMLFFWFYFIMYIGVYYTNIYTFNLQ